jgi:hypothetical protein
MMRVRDCIQLIQLYRGTAKLFGGPLAIGQILPEPIAVMTLIGVMAVALYKAITYALQPA